MNLFRPKTCSRCATIVNFSNYGINNYVTKHPKRFVKCKKKTSERVRQSEHEGNKKERKWKSRKENTQGILNQIGSTNYNLDYV